jgi:hypothetical protein
VRRQGATVPVLLGDAGQTQIRFGGLILSMACGFTLFDLFQRQQQLVLGQGLGPAAEAVALQFLDDLLIFPRLGGRG